MPKREKQLMKLHISNWTWEFLFVLMTGLFTLFQQKNSLTFMLQYEEDQRDKSYFLINMAAIKLRMFVIFNLESSNI